MRRTRLDNALHFHSFTRYRAPPVRSPDMARDLPCYSVADKGALAALRDSLRAAVGVRPARVHALSRTYYDTPDWRLYRAGRVLDLF